MSDDEVLLENIDHIIEKLDEAVFESRSQRAAITEAAGAMTKIAEIIITDELKITIAALACEELVQKVWQPWWDEFSKLDRVPFLETAYKFRRELSAFRCAVQKNMPQSMS